MSRLFNLLLLLSLLFASGCNAVPSNGTQAVPTTTSGVTPSSITPAGGTPTATLTPTGQPIVLRVWLPPQFDPAADTPAGAILRARLEQFQKRRPGVTLEVRIKAVNGPGGLFDSLTTASAAAPDALPDLVALRRDLLEAAAPKGLLYPYDDLSQAMESDDWFEYARSLGQLQQNTYGLPFAGDALALVYRPSAIATPAIQWREVITRRQPLIFAAADPQAMLTLALYQSLNGQIRSEDGLMLDSLVLTQVLSYYLQAETAAVMPEWLTQFQNEEEVWQAYQQERADQVMAWVGRYLPLTAQERAFAPLPTQDGQPYAQATGWVWALSARDEQRRALAVELAEYLTESSFLASWSAAAGVLPTRPSALKRWPDAELAAMLDVIARAAHIAPLSDNTTATLNSLLWKATVDVFKRTDSPSTAAQAAAAGLSAP